MNTNKPDRRRFLKNGVALAGLAVGGMRSGVAQTLGSEAVERHAKVAESYGERTRFETVARLPQAPTPQYQRAGIMLTPLQDSVGIITPSSLHYIATHNHAVPEIDPRQHRVLIHGLVDRSLVFTMEELRCLPSVSRVHFLECANNSTQLLAGDGRKAETVQDTHGKTSCSEWSGVPLSVLLKEAGVQKGAAWVIAEGLDLVKHAQSIPLEKAMDDIIVAYGQNGEALRPEQGYPLRLVTPGFEGLYQVKWLRRIKVVDQPYMNLLETTTYIRPMPDGKAHWFDFELPPKSVITRPSGGQRVPGRGFYEITGLAWSGGGAIQRVEVSTDGGRTWKDARIQEPLHRFAHTRFYFPWTWDGEETVVQSRCTDERGQVQPTLTEFLKTRGVDLNYWKTTKARVGFFNGIQPWKVTREGSVQNALL
ncbi:MAG: sulfite dehydrogenase [Acidobacteria bacterium]|nr:sulfite dehydrogenase [Acidobacteriota bacterium]